MRINLFSNPEKARIPTFTPFWTSTPQARKRTACHQREQLRQQRRELTHNPEAYIKIKLPNSQCMTVRQQIQAIKKGCPYKLRKPELKNLEKFLLANLGLHYIMLPKQRYKNRTLDFSDTVVKWIDQ